MLHLTLLNVVNTRASCFGHWLKTSQYNTGFCLLLHVRGQLVAKDQKLLKVALSGAEDPRDGFTEKAKCVTQL